MRFGPNDNTPSVDAMLTVAHVMSPRFFGGPERQVLELAQSVADHLRTIFACFREGGRCQAFLDRIRRAGFQGFALEHDTPRLLAAARELANLLRNRQSPIICCHGYKAGLTGLLAARWMRIPVIAVSRGWTGETWRVRLYEAMDRRVLRWMDRVVCVSAGQAQKVRRAGVPEQRIVVIRNAIRPERFHQPCEEYRERLHCLFPVPPRRVVAAAGRLSPEKGFGVLVDAAAKVVRHDGAVGFVLFGEGRLRESLAGRIRSCGLEGRFVLAGHRTDLDRYLPHADLVVLPSFSEGLPNVALEALAAGVPVVATAVGGTPEVVEHGVTGCLVPPGDPAALAERIAEVLGDDAARARMGCAGHQRVRERFSFAAQAMAYQRLFENLTSGRAELARSTRLNQSVG